MAKNQKIEVFISVGTTSYEKAVEAICQLNLVALSDHLRPNFTYQDLPKEKFLSGMRNAFDKFHLLGDSFLDVAPGHCKGCFPFKETLCFTGPVSRAFLSILIEKDELGEITDMLHCAAFCPVDSRHSIDRTSQEEVYIIPD